MMTRVKLELERLRFQQSLKDILYTPPVEPGDGDAIVFSQVCARDILMYLLAAKSFAHYTGLRRFAVLDDGSLTREHHDVLQRHLPCVRIMSIHEVRSDWVPIGGTWERLLMAARLGETAYVVQLDADTMALGQLEEVVESVSANRPFSLTSEPKSEVLPIPEAASNARRQPEHLLQFAVESQLECLYPTLATSYVRGCSGFTGLPPASRLGLVEDISRRMRAVMGHRWSEWGTEQVTTNLLTANTLGLALLAPPKYATHEGRALAPTTRFVHFMGTHRFTGSTYRHLAATVVDSLRSTSPARAA